MLIKFSLNIILLLIGIIIGVIAALVLTIEKENIKANRYLTALVLISVGSLFHNFLLESGIYNQQPSLYFLPVILSLGIGPLLYLYVNRLINLNIVSSKNILLHLLPLILQFVVYFICFIQPTNQKYTIYKNIYEPYLNPIQNIAVYISVGVYLYASFKEINFYKGQLNNFYSNSDKIALQWLQRLLFVFMFYYLLLIGFVVVNYSFNISNNYFPGDLIRCIIIFIIATFALKQNNLVNIQANIISIYKDDLPDVTEKNTSLNSTNKKPGNDLTKKEETIDEKPFKKISKSKDYNADLLKKIIDLVEGEQLFLNEELTIADLAVKLGYSTKTISQTINNGLNKSFSLFINEYRVSLFRKKKSSGKFDNLSIIGLAYDCGFNSKSIFNRIYKEITGASPKELSAPVKDVSN